MNTPKLKIIRNTLVITPQMSECWHGDVYIDEKIAEFKCYAVNEAKLCKYKNPKVTETFVGSLKFGDIKDSGWRQYVLPCEYRVTVEDLG